MKMKSVPSKSGSPMKSPAHAFVLAAALLLAGISISCSSGAAKLSDADVAAIKSATQQYVRMDEARNVDGLLRLIADDAVYMPPGIAPLNGRKAIEALAKAHPWENLAETPVEIDGRGDLAFVRGNWSVTLGGKPTAGSYIEVWQKRPTGAWQIIRKVWNTNT